MIKKALIGAAAGAGWLALRAAQKARREISLDGRVVLITGGSRGLGLVLARCFAKEGARLVLMARSKEELRRAEEELRAGGAEVLAAPGDVRNEEDVEAVVEAAIERFGRLDVVVNNAGIIQAGPLQHMTARDFQEAMDTHFWGAYHTTQAALAHLEAAGEGRIVNIASVGGLVAVPHLVPYCASKFALVGYSDGLRAELAPRGIRVTTVCPGLMRTGSHVNAFFKGRYTREYAWFSISDAMPGLSANADRAAREIVEVCRRGDPHLTITFPAKFAAGLSRLAPNLFAEGTALAARFLPAATGPEGDVRHRGWESFSKWAPSVLTWLADAAISKNNEGPAPPQGSGSDWR